MNMDQVRSFLAVAETGSFVAASERLHVTQSTISARIRVLEEALRCDLFQRSRSGAVLTPAGTRFRPHAVQMLRAHARACHETGLAGSLRARVGVGARFGLWSDRAVAWLAHQRRCNPDIGLRAEIAFEPDLVQGLLDGHLDIGLMYTPQHRPGLDVVPFLTERLLLVTSDPGRGPEETDYVHIEWGPEFDADLARSYAGYFRARLSFNIGSLGLQFLRTSKACAYFPRSFVQADLEAGRLHLVEDAPGFDLPSFVVLRGDRDRAQIDPMVEDLLARMRAEPQAG